MFPSIFVIVISLLNASTCAPSAAVNRNDPGGHRCYSCASVDKPYQCNVTTQCRPDEQCYTDEYSTNHGTSIFSVGCRRISECSAEIVRSDFSGRLKCEQCCHGNLCNSGGCSAGPAKGDVCYSCRFIDDPRHCENETRCLADEHCYIEKVLTQNFNIKFSLGCVDRAECETLRQFGMSIGKRDTAISTMYASCCNGDKCNDVWFTKGITSDTPRTSLATPKHHPTTQSSYVTTSSSMTKDTNVVDATNGMSSTSPSKTKDTTVVDATSGMSSTSPSKTKHTTVVHTTSGMSCTSPLKTEDTTIVDTTSGAPSTSPSKTKDTTVVDRTSGMSSTVPSKTKDTTVVHTTIGMPSTSPSKNKDATFVDTTSLVSSMSPSKTKHTTIVDTTSGAPSTSLSANKDTTVVETSWVPSTRSSMTKDTTVVDTSEISSTSVSKSKDTTVVHTSGVPSTSPSKTKETTVVDRTSGMSSTSPSMTKDTTVVHTSGAPSTSPSKTEDTTVFHTSGTHFSLIPKSSLYTFSTMGYTVTILPSTSTTPSKSTHESHHPGLLCARCDRVTDPLDCSYTTICEKDEACHIAHFVTSQGNLFYKLGCKAEQECQALHVGRRQNGDTVFDERCCTIHPECNRDLFKTSNDLSCGSCEDVTSPSDCEKVTTCRSNEVCERTVYLSDQFFLRYTLQCIQRAYCGGHVLHRTLSDDEYTDLCCDTNYCNMGENMKCEIFGCDFTNQYEVATLGSSPTLICVPKLKPTSKSKSALAHVYDTGVFQT